MTNTRRNALARAVSRRNVLRGAGVALGLPWLESLQPRDARAQAIKPPLRFLPIFLPNGAPELWKPQTSGVGAAWALSSVLEPLSALKSQVTVISGLENGSVFNVDGSSSVEPAQGRQPGAWLTCADASAIRAQRHLEGDVNGPSIDQVLAAYAPISAGVPLPSLQVGLSSVHSYCDGQPCSQLRSVSWTTNGTPCGKLTDPKDVFDLLAGSVAGGLPTEAGKRHGAAQKSVLDAVTASANVVRSKLSHRDLNRMDEYLDAVRELEKRVDNSLALPTCQAPARPVFVDVKNGDGFTQNVNGYDKGVHADLMNDLIVLAFQCNLTRVISYMLEDENSEFIYDNVPLRKFTASGSTPGVGVCGNYEGAQRGIADDYATITWWNVGKVAQLCQKLALIDDGDGRSVLDNSVVFMGACMHSTDQRCADLPTFLVGGGGGALLRDQHLALDNRPLRDLYFTLATKAFGAPLTDFGVNRTGAPIRVIDEILAT